MDKTKESKKQLEKYKEQLKKNEEQLGQTRGLAQQLEQSILRLQGAIEALSVALGDDPKGTKKAEPDKKKPKKK